MGGTMMVCSTTPGVEMVVFFKRRPIIVVPSLGIINVVYGPHGIYMPLAGFSVEEVQFSLCNVLNVGTDAWAYVDGVRVGSPFLLPANVRLEFMQPWGRKGAIDLENERVLSLGQAARWLPQVRGAKATGKGVHPIPARRFDRRATP